MAGEPTTGTAPAADPAVATPPSAIPGTPSEQPIADPGAPPAGQAPEPQVNIPALQAGYTQASQSLAVTRDALGLPRTASGDEIRAAIEELRTPKATGTDPDDPREVEFRKRAWTLEARVYGDELANHGQAIETLIRHDATPDQIMAAIYAAAQTLGSAPAAPTAPANGNGHAPTEGQEPSSEESLALDDMETPHGGLGLTPLRNDEASGLENQGEAGLRAFSERVLASFDRGTRARRR